MQLLRRIVAVFILSTIFTSELFSQVIDTARAFDNLRYRLSQDKKVTIAYLGGSITQGQGASNRAVTSWRPLTTTWFKQNYPQATVTEVDASWGATGSDLGAFRCTRDVCSRRPDLVFVEFAVNDWQKTSANVQPYMDGIVRNIWRTLPNCVIVFVYTVHNNTISHYDKGSAPPAVQAQQAVADHYNVCTINIGKALWLAIKNGKGTLSTYTADGTHPTDAGYKVYADEIAGVLKRHLLTPDVPSGYTPVTLSDPLVENTVDNGVIHMADITVLYRMD
jgi:lysophospholipase L1-like esterase